MQFNRRGRRFRIEIEYHEEEQEVYIPEEFLKQLQGQQGKNWKLLLADVLDVVGMLLGGEDASGALPSPGSRKKGTRARETSE